MSYTINIDKYSFAEKPDPNGVSRDYSAQMVEIEKNERIANDEIMQSNIDAEGTARISADSTLQENIDAEETARTSADTTLQSNIDAEETARASADSTLQENIDAEETARASADSTLQENIDSEETARMSADTTLQSNINAEETARISADTTLQENIDSEETVRMSADTTLQSNIDAEEAARETADNLKEDKKQQFGLSSISDIYVIAGVLDGTSDKSYKRLSVYQSDENGEYSIKNVDIPNYTSDLINDLNYLTKPTVCVDPRGAGSPLITYVYDFSANYNKDIRYTDNVIALSFNFSDTSYDESYTSALSFSTGEVEPTISYTNSGILNWVGSECAMVDGLSIFAPLAEKHYDIIFYFNGSQMIGLVNGFTVSSTNVLNNDSNTEPPTNMELF